MNRLPSCHISGYCSCRLTWRISPLIDTDRNVMCAAAGTISSQKKLRHAHAKYAGTLNTGTLLDPQGMARSKVIRICKSLLQQTTGACDMHPAGPVHLLSASFCICSSLACLSLKSRAQRCRLPLEVCVFCLQPIKKA